MSTNCENTLKVIGTPQQLHVFKRRFITEQVTSSGIVQDFSFQSIIPKPANITDPQEIANWTKQHWDIESDAQECDFDISNRYIIIELMTDNEPMSLKLLLKLSEMAPNVYLKLIYANYYNNFCGYYKVHNQYIQIQERDPLISQEEIDHNEELQRLIDEAIENGEPTSDLEEPYEEDPQNPWYYEFHRQEDCQLIQQGKRKIFKFKTNIQCRAKLDKYDRITLIRKVRDLRLNYSVGMSKKRALAILKQYYVNKTIINTICSICVGPLVDPISTKCNISHLFCKGCANTWIKFKNQCPNCRQQNAF